METGGFTIPPANENVKTWPLVGERIYQNWSAAAANIEGWLETHHEQVKAVLLEAMSSAAGISIAVLQFVLSVVIAAVAIGGMIHSGIIGLFLGAVVLALGYQLVMGWLESGEEPQAEEA